MAFRTPKGWTGEDDKLYVHKSGVRIHRTVYKEKQGWFLIPVEITEEVVAFEPTPEGRDRAFEHFAKEVKPSKKKSPRKPPVKAKASKKAKEEEPEAEAEAETEDEGDADEGDDGEGDDD